MNKAVFLIILLIFSACAKPENEFYNTKEEIMLRSYYLNDSIVSYLGVKDNNDILIVASKNKLISLYSDNKQCDFEEISQNEFNLPYKNSFLYFYKISCIASNATNMHITLNDNENIEIRRISKSLEYHL